MAILELVIIALVALLASGLTLFSGFGLGTLLLPAFALVLPLETAVAATAIVHLANNVWKAFLVGEHAVWRVVLRFGIPAVAMAALGAWLLGRLGSGGPWAAGPLQGTGLGTVLGSLIIVFSLFDLLPRLRRWTVAPKWLPLGGALSGLFGGLSGHQGALRGAFLTKVLADPKAYVATGVWCAILVDVTRLGLYGMDVLRPNGGGIAVAVGCVAAFAGAMIGKQLLGKLTMESVRLVVGMLMMLTGALLALGIV